MSDFIRVYDELIALCEDPDGAILAAAEADLTCLKNWVDALKSWQLISMDANKNIEKVETFLNTMTPLVFTVSEELPFDADMMDKHNNNLTNCSIVNDDLRAYLERNGTPQHNQLIADLAERLAKLIEQNDEDSQND